ncbi:MAG: hypothetical protein ABGY41_05455, partial [Candidatus Poribacteria bacterium]
MRAFDFILDIATDATDHIADTTITVTLPDCPDTVFPIGISIFANTCPVFEPRRTDTLDPASGGDGDGLFEGGERVTLRKRLKNVSGVAGTDVRITFSTDDPDIIVVKGRRGVGTWHPGQVRVFDFILDIAPDATEHD